MAKSECDPPFHLSSWLNHRQLSERLHPANPRGQVDRAASLKLPPMRKANCPLRQYSCP